MAGVALCTQSPWRWPSCWEGGVNLLQGQSLGSPEKEGRLHSTWFPGGEARVPASAQFLTWSGPWPVGVTSRSAQLETRLGFEARSVSKHFQVNAVHHTSQDTWWLDSG